MKDMTVLVDGRLEQITFKSGLEVGLSDNAILAIIGPNNSGKSTALAEIRTLVAGQPPSTKLVSSTKLQRRSSQADIRSNLMPLADQDGHIQIPGFGFHIGGVFEWDSTNGIGTFLASLLFSELTTRTRLVDCDPPQSFDARQKRHAQHPFQRMFADDRLEQLVSNVFKRAFKMDLVIHRVAGNIIPAYVGERPKPEHGEDRQSRTYIDRIEALEKLEQQGDGMRSFASVIGRVITENRPIRLIDEPEAFLHPPQAKILAETIAANGADAQTIIATHSSDILQGLLGDNKDRVSVVRLKRTPTGSTASLLTTQNISKFWNDPILRFSRVLDGLFSDGVILAEAEPDCRFYESLAEKALPTSDRIDVHYSYSGGKDRIPVLVSALTAVDVPVVSILDFDVLNNDQPLKRIIESHNGSWADYEADWLTIKEAVERKDAFLGATQFNEELGKLLKGLPKDGAVPKDALTRIRKLARNASPWDNVKDAGVGIVPKGPATIAVHRLLDNLSRIGIFIAPNGEMEGFCRTIEPKGIRWVEEVIKKDLASDPELDAARKFIAKVLAYLSTLAAR
ncbi:ABC-type cobalamin/Fe3+-siderophores transport system ATPase subunit [Neorhizobium sp. 2083]|uniref:ATP-dependent nuclease n=1 Tax=Neorhizobium sp. 2083 TaxID=2817762 RepID=UPI00285D474F|nr:AAA family ATPase [Neorhizobium sp. 2083]MDR6819573.1 ABC-type cobalamin/Fe3+-siderophores transport system ATPase subunit [Neorhizobium sp. 2083]